jgi:hypothetical protein
MFVSARLNWILAQGEPMKLRALMILLLAGACSQSAETRGQHESRMADACHTSVLAVKPGLCRVRSGMEVLGEDSSRLYATLECGEKMTDLCGGEIACDCGALVDPFPCESGRPDALSVPDGRYSDSEFYKIVRERDQESAVHFETYPYVTGPQDGYGDLFSQCELGVHIPRHGRCAVDYALESPANVTHFFDSIPFGESKWICGRTVRCECGH